MIDEQGIADIIATYRKHGWNLRRVLLSAPTAKRLDGAEVFGEAETEESDIDAMWFSRRARPGTETWELRAISVSPFALLENIPDEMPSEEAAAILRDAEERLAETVIRPSAENRG